MKKQIARQLHLPSWLNTISLLLVSKIWQVFRLIRTGPLRTAYLAEKPAHISPAHFFGEAPSGSALFIVFRATLFVGILLTVEFASGASVRIRLETSDLHSNVVSSVNVGDQFLLRGFVTDLRANPQGVFSSYLDVLYSPAASVAFSGEVTFIEPFTNAPWHMTIPGAIEKLGSFSSSPSPLGGGEMPQFNVRLQANAPGLVTFTGGPANGSFYDVLLYGLARAVPTNEIQFVNTSILVNGNSIQIKTIKLNTNGAHLTLTGPPNSEIQVQTVTNLTNLVWQNLGGTVFLGVTGTAQWIDLSATNHPMRFYRAFMR